MESITPLETREHRFFQLAQSQYLDHCATSRVHPRVPSEIHSHISDDGESYSLRDLKGELLGLYRIRHAVRSCKNCYSPTANGREWCGKCSWSGTAHTQYAAERYDSGARF